MVLFISRHEGEDNAEGWLSALHGCGWSTGALSIGDEVVEEGKEPVAPLLATLVGGVAHLTEAQVDEMELTDLKAFTLEHHAALVATRASHCALETRCAELAQRVRDMPAAEESDHDDETDASFAMPPPEVNLF